MNSKTPYAICLSHIGKRINHEDNFLINGLYLTPNRQKIMSNKSCCYVIDDNLSRVNLFAISDGMGGHNAGEVASLICVKKLAEAERKLQKCSNIKEAVAFLQSCIAEINSIVCGESYNDEELKGMGATLVIFVIFDNDYAVLNIGDSRAYYFNKNSLIQITKDHTEGQRILDLGLLTRKELINFPARKYLNRYIGYSQNGYVLRAEEYYPILGDDVILLCSDGLSDFLPDNQIFEILCSTNDLEKAGKLLINTAVSSYNADNATIILISLRR